MKATPRVAALCSKLARGAILCVSLVAPVAALCGQPHGARGSDLTVGLSELFEFGTKGTPSAVKAARAQHAQLAHANLDDRRLDYALGVVLANQHQYRDASGMLARYLESSAPELTAYYIKMWADMPLADYADVLKQATALGQRFPSGTASKPQKKYRDAASHLGTVFGYLELVRPSAVDSQARADRKKQILGRLGETYAAAFDEAHEAVAKRLSELQDQQKAELERLKVKAEDRKEQAKSAADETHEKATAEKESAKTSEAQADEAQQEADKAQKQLDQLSARRDALQSQLAQAQARMTRARGARRMNAKVPHLDAQLTSLRKQISDVNRQIDSVQKNIATLNDKEGQRSGKAAKDKASAGKAEKLADAAKKRLQAADAHVETSAGALDVKLARFANFAPLPYETERNRVLGWYSK